jgi:multiple antibiotic resistance protein MarB
MKPLLSAIAAAFILFSTQGIAEQTTQPVPMSWLFPHRRNNHRLI